jgi:glycosyltransferase involved in cell wall biosynthesis
MDSTDHQKLTINCCGMPAQAALAIKLKRARLAACASSCIILPMRVSVVSTVLDEAESLPRLLDSLAAQTRAPDEVIVCDGGSTDGTPELLEAERRFPLRVVRRPGANISQGRNAAIGAAGGDVIAVTDAGVRLSPQWLEKIVAPFEDDEAVQAVAGAFVPAPQTVFEMAMGATAIPEIEELTNTDRYPPSSRSIAFRRSAWEAVEGYPEWIDYCEDVIFDLRLRARFGRFVFAPEAVAAFRPRPDLRAFWRQYYRYACGDGKANLWPAQHLARYATFLIGPVLLIAGLLLRSWLLALTSPLPLAGAVIARSWRPWRRLARVWGDLSFAEKLQAALWVPVIRLMGDAAKVFGYPAGVLWRWRHRAQTPDWRNL